jgi:hypothetical protein
MLTCYWSLTDLLSTTVYDCFNERAIRQDNPVKGRGQPTAKMVASSVERETSERSSGYLLNAWLAVRRCLSKAESIKDRTDNRIPKCQRGVSQSE